jgi:hypothetical protein
MATIRSGYLWTSHIIGVNQSGRYTGTWPGYGDTDRTACEWLKFQIVADGAGSQTLTHSDYGRVFDNTTANRFYYMPSVAVNKRGDVVLGCSGSSAAEHIGAFFAGRLSSAAPWQPTDHAHKVDSVKSLKAAVDLFDQPDWGDYSYTCIDPTDDMTFWSVQEFGAQQIFQPPLYFPNWGTWIRAISPYGRHV